MIVEKRAAEWSDRMDLAEFSIEELAPPGLRPGGNDGSDSEKSTGLGHQGAGGCKEVPLDKGREEEMAEKSPDATDVFRQEAARNEPAIGGAHLTITDSPRILHKASHGGSPSLVRWWLRGAG